MTGLGRPGQEGNKKKTSFHYRETQKGIKRGGERGRKGRKEKARERIRIRESIGKKRVGRKEGKRKENEKGGVGWGGERDQEGD